MRHLTAIALLLAISAPLPAEEDAQTTPSPLDQAFAALHGEADQSQQNQPVEADTDVEVVEVFTAENAEELEAAFADGYPPPWLAEILEDETIPEEDRYWLDCRVRAAIACELHLFYDREGNPVRYDADRINFGEDYWRECFIVNIEGPDPEPDGPSPSGNWAGPGLLVNRYGEQIGEVAISRSDFCLSRDGSVGVTESGVQDRHFGPGRMNICFFWPDGTFEEFPIHHYDINVTASQSGELMAATSDYRWRGEDQPSMLYVFNRCANLLYEKELEYPTPNQSPSISPDDRYIAVATWQRQTEHWPVILYNAGTGEDLHQWDYTMGTSLEFSPDSRYLCVGGMSAGYIADCETGDLVWSRNLEHVSDRSEIIEEEMVRSVFCTNGMQEVYWIAKKHNPRATWPMLQRPGNTDAASLDASFHFGLSPNGLFWASRPYRVLRDEHGLLSGFQPGFQIGLVKGGE